MRQAVRRLQMCVVSSLENFSGWLNKACCEYGHNAFNLVGAPTSSRDYKGPTLIEAGMHTQARGDCDLWLCLHRREAHKER